MIYDSTDFVRATIHEIVYTLLLTGVIVLVVVFVFLQDWRATLIPALTIPVSLIGVFARPAGARLSRPIRSRCSR